MLLIHIFLNFSRNVVVFIVLRFYPRMINDLGLSKVFWCHAVIMFLGNIFVFFAMPETRGLTMTQLNEIFGGKVTHEKRNSYGDSECTDELEEKLTCNKSFARKTSSVANIAVSKAAATAALSRVTSAAAISRVASLARSMGAVRKGMLHTINRFVTKYVKKIFSSF